MANTYGTYTSGSTNWTAPAHTYWVIAKAIGGGGAGGGATGTKSAGGGGAGGAYTIGTLVVTPGVGTYPVVVGTGANGGTISGGAGGSSWFANTGSLVAPGGGGGNRSNVNNTGSAGATGGTTGAVGGAFFAGGNGAAGQGGTAVGITAGGGGGGGASDTGVGGNASGSVGGTGANTGGGHGGDGRGTAGGVGLAGTARGGGGGGAFSNNTTDRIGGTGAAGQILLEWLPPVSGELQNTYLRDDPNLLAYYRFQNDALDETTNNVDGTVTGVTYTASGKFDSGAAFSADRLGLGPTLSINSGGFSWSVWVKTSNTTAGVEWIGYKGAGTVWEYGMRHETGSVQLLLYHGSSGASYMNCQAVGTITDGNWHHIVGVYDNAVPGIYLYTDGTLSGSSTTVVTSPLGTTGTAHLYIGTSSGTANFIGTMDDMAFYSRALRAGEVMILAGSTNVRRNLIVNPSIEPDSLYWQAIGGTRAQNSAQYYSRTKSLLFTGTGVDDRTYWNFPDWGGSAIIGSQYAYSAYLYGTGTVSLWMYDGAADRYSAAITLSTTWTKYEILGTAAGLGIVGGIRMQSANVVNCFIDANMLEMASSTGAYFDGTTGGGVWEVGADTSSSYYITPAAAPSAYAGFRSLLGVGL